MRISKASIPYRMPGPIFGMGPNMAGSASRAKTNCQPKWLEPSEGGPPPAERVHSSGSLLRSGLTFSRRNAKPMKAAKPPECRGTNHPMWNEHLPPCPPRHAANMVAPDFGSCRPIGRPGISSCGLPRRRQRS